MKKNTPFISSKYKVGQTDLENLRDIRGFSNDTQKQLTQIKVVEKDIASWKDYAHDLFIKYDSEDAQNDWVITLTDIKTYFASVIHYLNNAVEKKQNKTTSDHTDLWSAFDSRILNITKSLRKLDIIAKDQLTEKDYSSLTQEINYMNHVLLPYVVEFGSYCRKALEVDNS